MTATKSKLNPISPFLLIVFLGFVFGVNAQNETKESFFPLAIGNYWIYSSTSQSTFDTLIITGSKIINSDTAFVFNNGVLLFERNDSVFDYQSARGNETLFKSLQFFPSDEFLDYRIFIGGDVSGRRSVSKIKGLYKMNGKEYPSCYRFKNLSDRENEIVICKGVGIIRIVEGTYIRELVEYKVME